MVGPCQPWPCSIPAAGPRGPNRPQLPPSGQLVRAAGAARSPGGWIKSPSGKLGIWTATMDRFAIGLRSSRQIPVRSPRKGEIGGPPAVTRWHGNLDRKRVRERSSRQERVRSAQSALVQRNGFRVFTPETPVRPRYALRPSSWSRGDLAAFSLRRTRVRIPQRTRSPARHVVRPWRMAGNRPSVPTGAGARRPRGVGHRYTSGWSGGGNRAGDRHRCAPSRSPAGTGRARFPKRDAKVTIWLARVGRRANPATAGPGAGEADRERGKGRTGPAAPHQGESGSNPHPRT